MYCTVRISPKLFFQVFFPKTPSFFFKKTQVFSDCKHVLYAAAPNTQYLLYNKTTESGFNIRSWADRYQYHMKRSVLDRVVCLWSLPHRNLLRCRGLAQQTLAALILIVFIAVLRPLFRTKLDSVLFTWYCTQCTVPLNVIKIAIMKVVSLSYQ